MSPPTPADAPRDGIEPVNSTRPEEDVIETVEPNAPADEPTPDATAQAAQADAVVDSAADAESDTQSDTQSDTESDTESATEDQAAADVMALLNSHVPLALLADLAQPEGPASPTILKDEGLPDVPWWE